MKVKYQKYRWKRMMSILLAAASALMLLGGCGAGSGGKVKLDPKNPITISVWHYYNGAILNAFESKIKAFNETVGAQEGIIVEATGMGNVTDLEKAVIASANKEIGSPDMPSIFASYADTAYAAEKMGLLANLGDYFTEQEQAEYIDSYIEEGKIGLDGELRIFPIAKSTEIFMINETDWQPFADAMRLTYDDLSTIEGVVRAAGQYYEWTDSLTPGEPNDGRAFFGRDGMANLFIIASKEFNTEIFKVEKGSVTIQAEDEVMRKIWDNYYLPYISGYFLSHGKFRSDDAKVGDILAYVGSTASASYFPSEVTRDGKEYPVAVRALPVPHFEGGERVMVQQGAGMVITKSTPQAEYASAVFLKWFTQADENIEFAVLSGYMPVKKEAMDYELLASKLEAVGKPLDDITGKTLKIAVEEINTSQLYTNKAFDGGAAARHVLDRSLQDKAAADREAVLQLMESGVSHEEAVARFNTQANYEEWLEEFTSELTNAIHP